MAKRTHINAAPFRTMRNSIIMISFIYITNIKIRVQDNKILLLSEDDIQNQNSSRPSTAQHE